MRNNMSDKIVDDKDFKNLFDYIENSLGGMGIESKINDFIDKFEKANSALIPDLLELMERRYGRIIERSGLDVDLIQQDITNFSDLLEKKPSSDELKALRIQYAYSYLLFISESIPTFDLCNWSEECLRRLYELLKKDKWINDNSSFDEFAVFFNSTHQYKRNTVSAKIVWLKEYGGKPFTKGLVFMLRLICIKSKMGANKEFAKRITDAFKGINQEFSFDNVEKLISTTSLFTDKTKPSALLKSLKRLMEKALSIQIASPLP